MQSTDAVLRLITGDHLVCPPPQHWTPPTTLPLAPLPDPEKVPILRDNDADECYEDKEDEEDINVN
jgi:hypothetical protein